MDREARGKLNYLIFPGRSISCNCELCKTPGDGGAYASQFRIKQN